MKTKERRLLGAQEILFYAMNEASPKHFLVVAEIEGDTSQTAWESAVAEIHTAHPMLNAHIVAAEDNLEFTDSGDANLPLAIVELTPAFDFNKAIEAELEHGFQSDKGPLARIKLFYSAQKCIVIIAAHHSISDALSSVDLVNDLLGILSGKTISKLPLRPSVDEFLGFGNESLALKINNQIKPGYQLPHEFTKQHPPAKVEVLHFSKELTVQLSEDAKKQKTTVHGILQAAAALSLKELSFPEARPAYIMSPFSIRKEMNIGTDFGLFIDTKIVAVSTDETAGFWNIARSATAELADVHSAEFLKSSAEQLRGLISYSDDLIQFIKDNFNFDIMLSNLGRLSFEPASPGLKLNYIAGPFIISGFNQQQAIGAATFNGQLVLTNSSRYLVPGLLTMMETKIKAALSR
ncbi:MAG: condensation domain-containing protein [Bacteroidota bacterium]|nr:condensation domain-containing protein [Bacteroidota bacterium]